MENAIVLVAVDLDFTVGTGTCVDGVSSEDVEDTGTHDGGDNDDDSETNERGGDTGAGGLPGFGLLLSITATLGAALIATRRK